MTRAARRSARSTWRWPRGGAWATARCRLNLACSGLAPNTREAEWLAIAGDNQKLQRGMERLYRLFTKAAVLGSLINPRAGEGDLLVAAFHELQPLLEKALAQEVRDDTAHEMAVTARGLAKAAEILAGQFTLVATNVPYLGSRKQDDTLRNHLEQYFPASKADLATAFVERCLTFCPDSGTTALVTPQNWLFLGIYSTLRKSLLKYQTWNIIARLGPRAFRRQCGISIYNWASYQLHGLATEQRWQGLT
ncbi:MAG: Eco57I restriction-modification methylase domain-containing protein [Gammaproteobacteria bacterium]